MDRQWQRLQEALRVLDAPPPPPPRLVHAANSVGAWRLQERLDLVRPGIFLYGGLHAADLPLPQPVASIRAPVVSLRTLPVGERVSYGGEWVAPRPTQVATLAIGYADGYPRAVAGQAHVLLCGQPRQVIGRVTMDFIMVALGDQDEIAVGDVATVVGRDGDAEITIDEFSSWANTIAYEVLTRLGPRLERRYLGVT